jgi:hypothetical protein
VFSESVTFHSVTTSQQYSGHIIQQIPKENKFLRNRDGTHRPDVAVCLARALNFSE